MVTINDRPTDVDGDHFLAGHYYHDQGIFRREVASVLPRSWVFACDEQEIPKQGDYVTAVVGTEPVLVVRESTGGEISAFLNVCPHRGSTLLRGSGNCAEMITCPYHGWRFGLDGGFRAAVFGSGLQENTDPARLGLSRVRVDRWRRFVFVNVSGDGPSLAEWLEDAVDATAAYPLEAAVATPRSYDRQSINWKLFWDINLDCYHIPTVHKNSVADEFRLLDTELWAGRQNTSFARMVPKAPYEIDLLPELTDAQRSGSFRVAVYPNFVATFEPDGHFFVSWVTPTSPGACVVGAIGYGLPDEAGLLLGDELERGMKLMKTVQDEDYLACRRTTAGMRSARYRPGPAHVLELQTERFHRWLRAAYEWPEQA